MKKSYLDQGVFTTSLTLTHKMTCHFYIYVEVLQNFTSFNMFFPSADLVLVGFKINKKGDVTVLC